MPSKQIRNDLKSEAYYLTLTVKNWYYIFDRHNRWDILLDSLKFCQRNKDLKIYAFVFMINHIHLIAENDDASGFIRDFKKFTSCQIINNIKKYESSVVKLFIDTDGEFSLWKRTNMPLIVRNDKFFRQKKEYIENNPVRKGYVEYPEHWIYSSAHEPCLLEIAKP